jgi:hypothetical protein
MEATFDVRFAELQAKIQAVLQMLINEYPAAAVRAREIIAEAVDIAAVQAEYQADEARANAVAALITGAGQMLATVEAPAEPEPEPEPEP